MDLATHSDIVLEEPDASIIRVGSSKILEPV
jgi:hypothetical protein